MLPAHNEIGNLPAVITRTLDVLPSLVERFELIIVDDGSTDGTGALLDSIAADDPRIVAMHHPKNRGYGSALRSGFSVASGDFIMFMDADQQFDIADLTFLAPFIGDYDIVAGYRSRRNDALHRIIYAWMFTTAMRIVFGIRQRDIDCAFKVFRAELLQSMELVSPGALLNSEILAKAQRVGATWVEVGVNHYPRTSGESSGGSAKVVFRAMKETMVLWKMMRAYAPHGSTAETTRAIS